MALVRLLTGIKDNDLSTAMWPRNYSQDTSIRTTTENQKKKRSTAIPKVKRSHTLFEKGKTMKSTSNGKE